MGRFIVKIEDKYFEWSTVVDAPVTNGLTREQMEHFCRSEYGNLGMADFEERMKRVEERGHSLYRNDTVEDLVGWNRAGPNEECLTLAEIYRTYQTRKESG